jgi:hypothetical protein
VALIFGANFFGALIIFLYFSVIDPLPVGGVAVRSLETEDIVIFGIAGVVIFVGAFAIISRLGRPIQNWLGVVIGDVRYFPPPILYPLLAICGFLLLTASMHLFKWIGQLHGKYAKMFLLSASIGFYS